jgi:hypothetical protein
MAYLLGHSNSIGIGGSYKIGWGNGGMNVTPLTGAKSMEQAVAMAKGDKSNSTYTDQVTFKTDAKTDQKIFDATMEKADKVNSGEEKYNPITNNCADAAEKPITEATGVSLPNNVLPNANFKNLKAQQGIIQENLDVKSGAKVVKYVPSGLDNIPPKRIVVPASPSDSNNNSTNTTKP